MFLVYKLLLLCLWPWFFVVFVMHVFDEFLAVFSSLFTLHRFSPYEKLLAVFVFIAGLSLRWISERLSITYASRESVVKVNGYRCYLWAAIDVDSREVLAIYVSRGRSMLNALIFLRRVLKACENKPMIVVGMGIKKTRNRILPSDIRRKKQERNGLGR